MAKKKQMEDIRKAWPVFNESLEAPNRLLNKQANGKRKQKWIHDKDTLLYGTVQYRGKLLGTVEVECCDDKETVQRVVKELKKKGASKLQEVDISISVRALTITEVKSKMHICKYKLQKIAYCSDDCGAGHKIFAFIAKKGDAKKTDTFFQCYCFETQNLAHTITISVGQAFQLAMERFQEAKVASEAFVGEMKKVKARRGKEDYVKKLAELHQGRPDEDSEERDMVPELSVPRMGRRASKDIRDRDRVWDNLRETLRIVCDDDIPLPYSNDTNDFEDAFEAIQNEIEEWNRVRSPYQSDLEVHDAIKELDSALDPFGSDSQTTLPQLSSDPEVTAM